MADPQYTDAQLSDGTTLRFNGQLNPDEVKQKVAAYRAKQAPPSKPLTWESPFRNSGVAGSMAESIGPEPLRPPALGAKPKVPVMTREPMPLDAAGMMLDAFTDPSPGAESSKPLSENPGIRTAQGIRKLSTPNQRLSGAADLINAAGDVGSPMMGPALLQGAGGVARLGAGLAAGYGASEAGEYAARKLGLSQGAQELAGAAGFWIPTGIGTLSASMLESTATPRQATFEGLTHDLMAKGGVTSEVARRAAADMIDKYEATGDARWINADNVSNPSFAKALGIRTLESTAKLKEGLKAGAAASLGAGHNQAPEEAPTDEKAELAKLMELRKSALPQVPLRPMPPNLEAVWQQSAFSQGIPEDIGSKVRASVPSIPRDIQKTSDVLPADTTSPQPSGAIQLSGDKSVSSRPPDPGEGATMPKQGDVLSKEQKASYPSKEDMRFRSFKKLEYTQRELQTAIESRDPDAIDTAHKRVVNDALTWAQFATPDDIKQAMSRMQNNLGLLGGQILQMRDMERGLVQGKLSFFQSQKEDVGQISRPYFRDVVGSDLPKIPNDFVQSLPQEMQDGIGGLKGRQRKEAIGRLWAAKFLREKALDKMEEFARGADLHAAIGKAKGISTPPKESFFLAKNVPVTQTPVSAEVGGEAATSSAAQPTAEPLQATAAAAGSGESVRATEGPEVGTPFSAEVSKPPSLQEAQAELARRTKEESSKIVEAGKVGVGAAKVDTNWFALAQEDLRKNLGREPSISEVAQHAAILKGKVMGIEDPQLEARIQSMVRRGMSRGTAERMARDQLAAEKQEADIREQQKARPGERGSFSFRKLQPMIGPLAQPPADRLAHFLDTLSNAGGALERSPDESQTRDITRKFAASLALDHLRLEAKLKEAISRHDKDTEDEFRSFMDAGEGKIAQGPVNWATVGLQSPHPQAPFMSVEDVATAQELHEMFQDRWGTIQTMLDKEPGGIENYLAHLWKQPGAGKMVWNKFFGKRPLEGNKIFLKQRFYEYASDGLDHGLEPITYNPIRLQLTALFQMDKFIAARELKAAYKDAGLAQWFKVGEHAPDGWQPLDDNMFKPKRLEEDGGLKEHGRYMAPPDVAKIFNRYVSPGLRGNPTYDAVRQYGNFLNQMNLGVSGYHGIFITGVAGASDVALGLEKIFNNKDLGGVKDVFRGTAGTFLAMSAMRDYQLGKKIQAEAVNPTGNAHLQAYVDSLVQAGGRFDQDPMYRTGPGKEFLGQLRSGKIASGLVGATKWGVQNFPVTKFIMEKYVPRIKLGMAAQMMDSRLRYLIQQGTTDQVTIANEMGKIWDSVDNRAGQMVYDNLFWNKSAKDISFLTVRAVGWDYGSAREGLGGLFKDPLQQTAKALRGERPEMTHRMAFVIGTTMTMATLGAVTTYLVTGKAPQKLEDYFYPYSGRIGPDGKPERMSYPSYMKDAFAFANGPGPTALHKLHPMIGLITDLYQNKDFYNTEIYAEGDPWYSQGQQILGHIAKAHAPFIVQMGRTRQQQGIPAVEAYGESFLGLQRAPAYVTQTPAEQMTLDFAKRRWQAGPLTSRERDQRDTYNSFKAQLAAGQLNTGALSDAFRAGKLRPNDLDRLFEDSGLSSFQQEFKSLKLPEALKVMKVARPEERQALKPFLLDKLDQLEEFPVPEEQAYYQGQIQKYLQ